MMKKPSGLFVCCSLMALYSSRSASLAFAHGGTGAWVIHKRIFSVLEAQKQKTTLVSVNHGQETTASKRTQTEPWKTASWKRRDRLWFALLEFALSVKVPRGIAVERDCADCTMTPTRNKTKMKGFVDISTLLIHSASKQKSNEWNICHPFIPVCMGSGSGMQNPLANFIGVFS